MTVYNTLDIKTNSCQLVSPIPYTLNWPEMGHHDCVALIYYTVANYLVWTVVVTSPLKNPPIKIINRVLNYMNTSSCSLENEFLYLSEFISWYFLSRIYDQRLWSPEYCRNVVRNCRWRYIVSARLSPIPYGLGYTYPIIRLVRRVNFSHYLLSDENVTMVRPHLP